MFKIIGVKSGWICNFFLNPEFYDICWSDPDDLIGSGSDKMVRLHPDPQHWMILCSPVVDPAAALSLLETQKQAKKQMETEKRSAMRSMTDMKKRLEAFKAAKEQPETGRRGRETNKR